MKHKIFSLAFLLMIVALFAACGPMVDATEVPASSEPSVQGDPKEGEAALIADWSNAGAKVELGDSVEQPFFSVKGRILKVNGAEVQVFEYQSAEAMEAEAALVSADGGSVGTSMMMWMATPHFFKSGRVLVLYVGDNASILELLKGALGDQFAGG